MKFRSLPGQFHHEPSLVKWKHKKTNAEVLNLVKEKKSLLSDIRKRKRNWIGHILRHENMLRTVLEGRMKGKRPRGRKRINTRIPEKVLFLQGRVRSFLTFHL